MNALLNGRTVRGTIQGDAKARKLVPQLIELRRQGRFPAAENDVAITRLDPLSNWNPRWLPANMDASYIDHFDIEATEFFDLREQPGITYCSLNATFAEDIYTAGETVEHFASACDLAARYDVTCDLENLPMRGVKTLRHAWSIVSAAGRQNGGIVFDTLHYIRSGSTPRATSGPQRPSRQDAAVRWLTRRGPYSDQYLARQAWQSWRVVSRVKGRNSNGASRRGPGEPWFFP